MKQKNWKNITVKQGTNIAVSIMLLLNLMNVALYLLCKLFLSVALSHSLIAGAAF